jgi:DNA replication and repair protein RecF
VEQSRPHVAAAYDHLAGQPTVIDMRYEPQWRGSGLASALAAARPDDVRRGVSTVGPHRDELELRIAGMPARTHASQGEQRTLALALRLGVHRLVAERTGSTPVLVLDDVLSELDSHRATALLGSLPAGQIVITTAGTIPSAATPERIIRIAGGAIVT